MSISKGMDSIKKTVSDFNLQRPLAQLVFIQTRIAVGGITECELIAYRRVSNLVIDKINDTQKGGAAVNRDIKSFHVKSGTKDKKFKNKHIAILMESITSDYYKEIFGLEMATAIIEQDEVFLNDLLAEHLPKDFGSNVIISLKGDIDEDVERLVELVNLLVKRSIKELVPSQTDSVKVRQCNPWVAIQQRAVPVEQNHLVVNYIDNSQESLLDIDLLQQILYTLGMLKKIQNKEHQARAAKKIAENKRIYDEVHKDLPKERDVYDILPESILGAKRRDLSLEKQGPKDIKADSKPKTIKTDDPNKIDESNSYGSNDSRPNKKSGLLGFIKKPFSVKLPMSKEKKEKQHLLDLLAKRLTLIDMKYLTNGILDDKQPNTQGILYTDYNRDIGSSIKGIKVIESILDATLNNKDEIDSDNLNYEFIDVTAGIFSKLKWESNKYDI